MTITEALTRKVSQLPLNRQLEVLNFVEFLERKQGQTEQQHDPEGLLASQPSNLELEDFVQAQGRLERLPQRNSAMTDLVLDTHALVWYLERSNRLSDAARSAIKSCLEARRVLYVPVVSLVEILYLDEKERLPTGSLKKVLSEVYRQDSGLTEAPFVAGMVETMTQVDRDTVPDLPDRMIAATALYLALPL